MGGALMASEAVLQALLVRAQTGQGTLLEVALADAAAWLAQPRHWGLTTPDGDVGGAHAGYRIYPCADGRVAVAALEPHFAARLCAAAGLPAVGDGPAARPCHARGGGEFHPHPNPRPTGRAGAGPGHSPAHAGVKG